MHVRRRLGAGLIILIAVCTFPWWRPSFAFKRVADAERAPKCPTIHDVSPRPLGEQNFNGASEKIETNGQIDDYLHDQDGKIKVGIREQWGASIVYFGQESTVEANAGNTIDDSDQGRGIQLRFHDDARAFQGCAYNATCFSKKPDAAKPCGSGDEFTGWSAVQGGDLCGQSAGIDGISRENGLITTVTPRLANPAWNSKTCENNETICATKTRPTRPSGLRISQSLRFVRRQVLEVELLVTNLTAQDIVAEAGELNEFPSLYASPGRNGAVNLNSLRDAEGNVLEVDPREPASAPVAKSLRSPGGWATFQDPKSEYGVGIYWENRNDSLRARQNAGELNHLRSNFAFSLPASETVRGRFYLLLGGFDTVKSLAEELDKSLPPFGRIEASAIQPDTRTVALKGWALDNKDITQLELWIDNKKISDLALNADRHDICATYPGYAMCASRKMKVGFETTFARPAGQGCAVPLEVRARDSDGNTRVIARKSISPVVY